MRARTEDEFFTSITRELGGSIDVIHDLDAEWTPVGWRREISRGVHSQWQRKVAFKLEQTSILYFVLSWLVGCWKRA